jgi:hypothetical protein
MYNSIFHSNDQLTNQLRKIGITSWEEFLFWLKQLPYGRNANRTDFSLVISEMKGTCSSKHGLAKLIAENNKIEGVKLVMCIFNMSEKNTPKLSPQLTNNHLDFIPEAHCYIRHNGKAIDLTTSNSAFQQIEKDILKEEFIDIDQLNEYKVNFHQAYLKNWIAEENNSLNFNDLWSLREECIKMLSE